MGLLERAEQRTQTSQLRSRRETDKVSSYIEVKSPSDVAGVKLLMIDHESATDEQLTYLPQFKRVNRISGSSRKGAFIGSDFSYEDLDIREAAEGRIIDFNNALAGRELKGYRLDSARSLVSRLQAGLGDTLLGLSEAAQLTALDWAIEVRNLPDADKTEDDPNRPQRPRLVR